MREIKYRAWDKEDKCMKRVFALDFAEWWVATNYYGGELGVCDGERNSFKNEETDRHILMQYTGLTLSDGTDIYEGDVLRLYGEEPYDNGVVGMDYDWEFFGTVVFQDGSFVVQEFSDKCCIWIDAIFCEDIDVEKLGNIHDNPELLEDV